MLLKKFEAEQTLKRQTHQRRKNYSSELINFSNSSSINSFHSIPVNSKFNNFQKPLSDDFKVSFKGFSLGKNIEHDYGFVKEAVESYGKVLGKSDQEYISGFVKKYKQGEKVVLNQRGVMDELLYSVTYPFKNMWLDMANASLDAVSKLKGKEVSRPTYLAKRKEFVYDQKIMGGINGYLSQYKEWAHPKDGKAANVIEKTLTTAHDKIDPLKGNFNSAVERFLTRWESGMISAIFLANDAYNLTRLIKDDHKDSTKEKKTRIKQEVGRVALSAGMMFTIMNALKKYTNKSLGLSVAVTVGSTFVAEIIGRKFAGKRITPVHTEDFDKNSKKNDKDPKTSVGMKKNAKFAAQPLAHSPKPLEVKAKPERLMEMAKFFGAASFSFIAAGAALKRVKGVQSLSKTIAKAYEKATVFDTKIKKDDLVKIINKLKSVDESRANHYIQTLTSQLAEKEEFKALKTVKLEEFLKTTNMDRIPIAQNRAVKTFIDTALIFPVKTVAGVLKFPYTISKYIGEKAGVVKKSVKTPEKIAQEKLKEERALTQNVIKWARKNLERKDFAQSFKEKTLLSFDNANKQTFSSSELGNWTKFLGSATTGYFLVNDSYNLVMEKTDGKDARLAGQKAKERTAQEVSRLFFSTYIVKMFNDNLKGFANRNLINNAINVLANVTTYELFTRMSVGLPVKPSSRKEILELEAKNQAKQGIAGDYNRFMSYVTGKKALSTRLNDKK